MATTPRLALPYPVGTDTPDVPRDVLALATRLEAIVQPAALALPAAPYDGQLSFLQAAVGVVWAFRWNGATARWDFIGGPPLVAVVEPNQVVGTLNAWTDVATVGPSIIVPRAGDYDGEWVATANFGANAGNFNVGVGVAAGAPSVAATASMPANGTMTLSSAVRFAGLAAADELRMRYYVGAAAIGAGSRRLRVRPVTVS